MYKIYINETLVVLMDSADVPVIEGSLPDEIVAEYAGKSKFLLNYIDLAEKGSKCRCIILHSKNYKKLKKDFKGLFKIELAAGGLVINEEDEGLIIFRRGFWDLPKGKLEGNETKKQGALREVEEEVGISGLEIDFKLPTTFHTYRSNIRKHRILKKTHWYLMRAKKAIPVPQAEEGILDARWVKLEEFLDQDPKIFSNIRDLIRTYTTHLVDQ